MTFADAGSLRRQYAAGVSACHAEAWRRDGNGAHHWRNERRSKRHAFVSGSRRCAPNDLRQVHMGALQEFIGKRKADGVKTKTLNAALAVVRRILNLAAAEWIDEKGMTWLETAPKIKLLPVKDARSPYPLTQEEQGGLFQELPDHLARMALFEVNTGCREQEVCGLRWDYEVKVPALDTSVFLIPKEQVKNGEERLVVLNRVAKSVVESLRGLRPTHVFARVRGPPGYSATRAGGSPRTTLKPS
jgi:integrase